MGLSEIGCGQRHGRFHGKRRLQPGRRRRNCGTSSSEHIAVTRAAGITEVLAVPGSGGFDFFPATRRHRRGSVRIQPYWLGTMEDMQIKRSVAMC